MDDILKIGIILIVCYLLGAIPSSYMLGKLLKGIDLREHGSGNLGAANTFRVLGARAAVPVLMLDIGKGFAAVKMTMIYGPETIYLVLIAALVVIMGHNYSIFVNFSGGKGVGTTAGAFLAMSPVAIGICLGIWFVVLFISRIVSVASMVSAIVLPIAIWAVNRYFNGATHMSVMLLSIVVALLVVYKHRSNIRRLKDGTENRIF